MRLAGRRPVHETAVLQLALGCPSFDPVSADWESILRFARRERCLRLAWQRSGALIRSEAPSATAAEWRRAVFTELDRSERQLRALGTLVEALDWAGVEPVVLKGAPLSLRLYGDPSIRPSTDLDVFISQQRRREAGDAIRRLGWAHVAGEPPWEESFQITVDGHRVLLEIHSFVLDDPVLAHLTLPEPTGPIVVLQQKTMRTFDDALLPAYLATHLAKHDFAPLLWMIDFYTLWDAMPARERAVSIRAARRHGLHRYLEWAARRSDRIEAALTGDTVAWRAIGYAGGSRVEGHSLIRVARLAATPQDAARVIGGRLYPPHLRGKRRGFVRQLAGRLARRVGSTRMTAPGVQAATSGQGDERVLSLESPELSDLIGEVVSRGGSCWLRVSGQSMQPTIPSGAVVRLSPLNGRLRGGEVVLALLPSEACVLHRVIVADDTLVVLEGDGNLNPDPPTTAGHVIALATGMQVAGRTVPIPRRPVISPRRAWLRVRAGLSRGWRQPVPGS